MSSAEGLANDSGVTDPDIAFTATICKVQQFTQIFDSVRDVIKNCVIYASRPEPGNPKTGGFTITVLNAKGGMLVKIRLPSSKFEKFYVSPNSEKPEEIGIKLAALNRLLSFANADDVVTLTKRYSNKNILFFEISNDASKIYARYEIVLSTLKAEPVELPDTKFVAQVTIQSTIFHRLIAQCSKISDDLTLRFVKNANVNGALIFEITGDLIRNGGTCLTNESAGVAIKIDSRARENIFIKGKYELKRLALLQKCQTLCECAIISIKRNFPLTLRYKLAEDAYLLILLSKKPEEDECDDDDAEDEDDIDESEPLPNDTDTGIVLNNGDFTDEPEETPSNPEEVPPQLTIVATKDKTIQDGPEAAQIAPVKPPRKPRAKKEKK